MHYVVKFISRISYIFRDFVLKFPGTVTCFFFSDKKGE